MFPYSNTDQHETTAGKWVRTITTAFVLAAAAIGLAVPETEGNNSHSTREEALEEKRKDLTDYHHHAHVRSEAGSGAEAQEISLVTPHYTVFGSGPEKSDIPTPKG